MMSLVERNSSTISANTEVLKALHRRFDRFDQGVTTRRSMSAAQVTVEESDGG